MDFPALFLLLLKGFVIGFAIAAPVGPVGILCIRRTLSHQKLLAGVTGLGSACADVFYATITAFSLAGISNIIVKYDFYLRFFGAILLVFIGVFSLKAPALKTTTVIREEESLFHAFSSAFMLTISNPITLFVFATSFTAMGIAPTYTSFFQAFSLVTGVFIGASCWWLSLITLVHLMKHKLSETKLLWINRFSSAILLGFAAYILASLVFN